MSDPIFPTKQPDHTFLLRCWQESAENGWRYRLEDPSNGTHWSFSELASVVQFLDQRSKPHDPFDSVFDSAQTHNL